MNKIVRIKMVKAMEYIMRQCNNEEIIEDWLENGVADGDIPYGELEMMPNDEASLYTYVDTDEDFSDLMRIFLEDMQDTLKDGGLYCDDVCSTGAYLYTVVPKKKEERTVNTKVMYMYRDASNYKIHSEEIVAGSINEYYTNNYGTTFGDFEFSNFKQHCLIDGEYFYPAGVGLPNNNFQTAGYAAYEDDPDWSEFIGFEETKLPPTGQLTITDLMCAFERGCGQLPF